MRPTVVPVGITRASISQESFVCESISNVVEEEYSKRCVPTQTQIRQQLGSKLSDVFFEYVGNEGKAYLGLEPPLVGPDTVWINPDARLGDKVSVTPVPEPAVLHLKAFTHGSILEVGEKYIEKLENQHRLEMEEALTKQAQELEEEFMRRMAYTSNSELGEGSGQCKKVVATLMEHFDSCFKVNVLPDLVETMRLRMRKECQLKVKEERAEVASYMLSQLQEEVERRDLELCDEFHGILYSELNILATRYIKQINNEREIAVELLRETVRNYEKMLQDMRTELELTNVVDVCRAITQERMDCSERVRQIENTIRSKQADFYKYIKQLEAENCTLQKMSTERLKRLMQWRKKIRELLQEYQRFINFALKAVPGQSEYLLSMEKLMLKKFPEDSFLLPGDYLHFKNCLKNKLSDEAELEVPEVREPSEITTESENTEEKGETSGGGTPPYCRKSLYEEGTEPGMTFDYNMFKSILMHQFGSNMSKPGHKRKPRKAASLRRKKTNEISIDKSSELYHILTLAGENEKEHLAPVNCFLQKRLKAVRKICEDDPELATIILGCSRK